MNRDLISTLNSFVPGSSSLVARILLLTSNVIPLVGVVVWDWDVAGILILYWSENLVIGALTIGKMLAKSPIGGLFTSAFFLVHFGGFCAIHGIFVLELTRGDTLSGMLDTHWPFFLVFVELLVGVTRHVLRSAPPEWIVGFVGICVSHFVSLLTNYIGRREYEDKTVKSLMMAPYGRIVIMHITILAGGAAVLALGSPAALLIVLVIVKTIADLFFHIREHSANTQPEPVAAQT